MLKNMVVFLVCAGIGQGIRRVWRARMAVRKPEKHRAITDAEEDRRQRRKRGAMEGYRKAMKLIGK